MIHVKRGFAGIELLVWAAIALAILGAIGGIMHSLKMAGVNEERAAQAERDRKQQEMDNARRDERKGIIQKAAADVVKANAEADDYRARWRKEKNRGASLATCDQSPSPAPAAGGGVAGARLGVRFTPDFVRLWDGAWTGPTGQPIFGDRGELALGPAAADSVESPGVDAVLDNHEENASRCSKNSRQLKTLVDTIKKLRAQRVN